MPIPPTSEQHVGILMATYEGDECLNEQLDSLADQTHINWQLMVSDDGSSDDTCATVDTFAKSRAGLQKVTRISGPRRGAAANFMSLIRRAPSHLPEDSWLAFCDQDDVWLPDRLERGLAALARLPPSQPALFCARTWVVGPDLSNRRLSPARPRPPGFLNALAQNIAAGNTILLNPVAARIIMEASTEVDQVVMHDWWVYLMVTGMGGHVVHDDEPVLFYRQHAGNEIGANTGWLAKMRRLVRLLKGDYRRWNDINIAALQAVEHRLQEKNGLILGEFAALRRRGPLYRLTEIRRLKLYRQSATSTFALWLAALLGRL